MLKYDNEDEFCVKRGYINRTKIYLWPAVVLLKSYKPFIQNLKENLLCVSYKNEKLVAYYDRKNTVGIHHLLAALKNNGEYINDYMHNENIYAIEIKPNINYSAFEEGRYSGIYTIEQINKTFTHESQTRKVLTKNPEYKQQFVDYLNNWFNTNYSIDALESREDGSKFEISEYDISPCMNQEILNYERTNRIGEAGRIEKSGRNSAKVRP